jgi:hypothetical protein
MANYKIIGADGRESGLVAPEDLRKWAAEGRVGPETMAQAEGTSEWVSLGRIPELAGAFKVAATPPPVPAGASPSPAKTSVMAILSLIFGILGIFLCITSLPALILGIIAMVNITNSKGALKGWGLALTGIILSALALLLAPAMLLPALAAAKYKAQEISCLNNERQLMLAVRVYASQHDNQFPPAATWCDVIDTGPGKILKCPALTTGSRCDYAFNARLGGMDESKISPDTVVFFESDGGWDANGGPEMLISTPRHRGIYNVVTAGGQVKFVKQAEVNNLRWEP